MRSISKKGIAIAAVGALAFGLVTAGGVAQADVAPSSGDITGVGSDTLQYMLDFTADGDFSGDAGYNAGKLNVIANFDATPDANARAGYLNGSVSTTAGIKPLNPTIVLRAGSKPVQRPNGSGAGVAALLLDTGSRHSINYARSSSPLSSAQIAAATAAGGIGNLHEVRLAKDDLAMATAGNGAPTHAVPLSKTQLFNIYQCNAGYTTWNGANVGGTSSDTIIPVIPQVGSGTRKTFLTDIGFTLDSNGNPTPALGGCVKTYEENDPYALYLDSSGNQIGDPYATSAVPNPDAIEPMSGGRLALYASGYFTNPNAAFKTAPPSGDESTLAPEVALQTTGSPTTGGAVYDDVRGLYVVFRDSDATSTTHFNGGTINWAQTLFLGSSSFVDSAAGQALIAAAGVTPDYADCGVNPADASACGPL
jgi:PBP superfamily domain